MGLHLGRRAPGMAGFCPLLDASEGSLPRWQLLWCVQARQGCATFYVSNGAAQVATSVMGASRGAAHCRSWC